MKLALDKLNNCFRHLFLFLWPKPTIFSLPLRLLLFKWIVFLVRPLCLCVYICKCIIMIRVPNFIDFNMVKVREKERIKTINLQYTAYVSSQWIDSRCIFFCLIGVINWTLLIDANSILVYNTD